MKELKDYNRNVFSQNGEDGILEEVFNTLGIEEGVFCEFGAWDGMHCSNTYHLYQKGWSGWYIEGDKKRFQDLSANVSHHRAEKVLAWVTTKGQSSLDSLLQNTNLYKKTGTRLDLLSIDIDSDDLSIWQSVKHFRPTIVVIEFNWNIPFDTYFENPPGENKGNSALSICKFAELNGYDFIAMTSCNLIFIDKTKNDNLFKLVSLYDSNLKGGPRYFFGYDGTLIIGKAGENAEYKVSEIMLVPWNSGVFSQPVIKAARVFGSSAYCKANFIASLFSTLMRRPISTIKCVVNYFNNKL
jgi:hypothetical protein